jgi:Xaa-Pro dipeptidase
MSDGSETANGVSNLPGIDERSVRAYRLERVKAQLVRHDLGGIVLFDPINVRYATGSRNMQVWAMHNAMRYAFIAPDGPVIVFDYPGSSHLSDHLETVDEHRPAVGWDFLGSGPRNEEHAERWAAEIADLVARHGGGNRRLAMDRADLLPLRALMSRAVDVVDGKGAMEIARSVKSNEEIRAMRHSIDVCAKSMTRMREVLEPGVRESEMLATLIYENVRLGGEYPETRLLTSGPRTNPWLQETSDRALEPNDLVAFDTDLIGPFGFFTDVSRTWLVGEGKPSDEQRRLYTLAREQLEHNTGLLRPGLGFLEMTEKSWKMPDAYVPNRYAEIVHGAGMAVEYPMVFYPEDVEASGYDGIFEENMVVCVESYIGAVGGREGVKLEQPVVITRDGSQPLCTYPFEDHFH